jgi:hypothetical protein
MSEIRRVYSQPNASSLKEGEEVVYLGSSKPLARYRKEGGQIWISYMTTNGDLFVDKDFNVQGTISQGGSGGGTGKPVVKGGLVETKAGGLGASYSAAVTMNTLTDANSIRSRLTAGLDSSGNVDRTVAKDKGGFGADASTVSVALITDNIEAGGLKAGRNIGDSVKGVTIFNEFQVARAVTDDATIVASDIWWQTDDTPVIKCIFNYVHDTDNKTMKASFLMRTDDGTSGKNAIMKLAIYDYTIGGGLTDGSTPNTGVDKVTPVTYSTNRTVFDGLHNSPDLDISGLSAGIYKVAILLYNEDDTPGAKSYLTGPVVIVYGA